MSVSSNWKTDYVDSRLCINGITDALICDKNDGTIWGISDALAKEAPEFPKRYESVYTHWQKDSPVDFGKAGFELFGVSWIPVLIEDRNLYARRDEKGIVISTTEKAAVIAMYNTSKTQPGQAAMGVQIVADFLRNQKF